MNFLLDMNIPRTLGPLLEREGHRCRHVGRALIGGLGGWSVGMRRNRWVCSAGAGNPKALSKKAERSAYKGESSGGCQARPAAPGHG